MTKKEKREYIEGVKRYHQWKRECDKMEKLFKEGQYATKKEKNGQKKQD